MTSKEQYIKQKNLLLKNYTAELRDHFPCTTVHEQDQDKKKQYLADFCLSTVMQKINTVGLKIHAQVGNVP
jgi:hypothetical protein